LIDLLTDHGYSLPVDLAELDRLTPYAVEFRYELLPPEAASNLDRQAVRKLVQKLRDWVETKIGQGP